LRRGFFFSLLLSQKSSSHSIRKTTIFAAKNDFPDDDKNDSDGHEGSAKTDTNQEEAKTKPLFNEQRAVGDWPER
jgi:hypothetical protein